VDDVLFIDDSVRAFGYQAASTTCQGVHDFPDQCIAVNSGQALKAQNSYHAHEVEMTFIGYFEKVGPVGDLNGDGIVNMLDFAMMAEDWLESTVVDY
jgi:hypothetical protein